MNGWFIVAGLLQGMAFFIHVVFGNKFYAKARPARSKSAGNPAAASGLPAFAADEEAGRREMTAYEAWLMGRCGVQMITVDLALTAVFVWLLGLGVIPRNAMLELFLVLTYAGWSLFWLLSLVCEKSGGRYYVRLCHWFLFLTIAVLLWLGIRS